MEWNTVEGLRKIAMEGRKILENHVDEDDMAGVSHKLNECANYIGTLSQAKAQSLNLLMKAKARAIRGVNFDELGTKSHTIHMQYVDSQCGAELALHELCKSLEKNMGTVMDAYRTIISFRKTEIEKGLV